jgi:hypothetical protein
VNHSFDHTFKNHNKGDAQAPKLLFKVYSMYIIYKCGHKKQEKKWWADGWTPMVKKEPSLSLVTGFIGLK